MQSYGWGQVKKHTGSEPVYALCYESKSTTPTLAVHMQIKRFLHFRIGYVPRGPVVLTAKHTPADIQLEFLKQLCDKHKLDSLIIDPQAFLDEPLGQEWVTLLNDDKRIRLTRQIQPRGTAITDLSNIPALIDRLDKGTRYNIRLAEKRGVEIKIVPATAELMEQFYALYVRTGGRKGFGIYTKYYYLNLIERLGKDPNLAMYFGIAEHPDEAEPLGMAFLLHSKEQFWYFYATSSSKMRNLMPNYALQWRCLEFAKAQGAKTYDWWGAPFDPANHSDQLYSVWHFKKSFLPEHKQLVGAHTYRPKGFKSAVFALMENGRNAYLKLIKKLRAAVR